MEISGIHLTEQKGFTIITFADLPAMHLLHEFNARLTHLCDGCQPFVALDFIHLVYLNSLFIGSLAKFYKLMNERKKKVAVINAASQARDVMESVKLDLIMPIMSDAQAFLEWTKKEHRPFDRQGGISVSLEHVGDTVVIKIDGDPVSVTAADIGENLRGSVRDLPGKNVVIDLQQVIALDSSAIGFAVEFSQSLEKKGGTLVFANVNEVIRDLITILNLEEFFSVAGTVDEAKKMLDAR
jgi:anti-anti-sigma factor